jgi:hypothetical protein
VFAASLKQGLRGSLFVISVLFLALFVTALFYSETRSIGESGDIFRHLSNKYLSSTMGILLTASFCIAAATILIVLLINQHEISEKLNFFPVFLYVIWAGLNLQTYELPKALLINVFLLFALYKLLNTYRNENALSDLFLSAFCIGITLFLSAACFIYFPLFFIGLFILKPMTVREFFVSLMGFLCPLFLYECLAYLGGSEQWYVFHAFKSYTTNMHLPIFNPVESINTGLVGVLIILSALSVFFNPHSTKVKTTKAKTVCWWWLGGALVMGLSFYGMGISFITLLLPFFVFISGDFLYYIKRPLFVNAFIGLILLCVLSMVLFNLGMLNF